MPTLHTYWDPAFLFLGMCPPEICIKFTKTQQENVHGSTICNFKNWKQPKFHHQ